MAPRLTQTIKALCSAGTDEGVDAFLKDFFHSIPFSLAFSLRCLFWLFWWAPFICIRRFRTLGGLNAEEQQRYFTWWEKHRWYWVREFLSSLKTISLLARVGREWDPTL